MADSALSKKLQIKSGQRLLLVNAPPGYLQELQPLPEGAQVVEWTGGTVDFVQVFAKSSADLNRLVPMAVKALKHDGLFWVWYPKRSSKVETDLTRDEGWAIMSQYELRPVSQVAVDDTWSAVRFRPIALVKSKAG